MGHAHSTVSCQSSSSSCLGMGHWLLCTGDEEIIVCATLWLMASHSNSHTRCCSCHSFLCIRAVFLARKSLKSSMVLPRQCPNSCLQKRKIWFCSTRIADSMQALWNEAYDTRKATYNRHCIVGRQRSTQGSPRNGQCHAQLFHRVSTDYQNYNRPTQTLASYLGHICRQQTNSILTCQNCEQSLLFSPDELLFVPILFVQRLKILPNVDHC